jgi:hypothetical protein
VAVPPAGAVSGVVVVVVDDVGRVTVLGVEVEVALLVVNRVEAVVEAAPPPQAEAVRQSTISKPARRTATG